MEFSYFVGSNIFGCNPETEGVLMNFFNAYVYDFVGNTWHIFETTEVRLLLVHFVTPSASNFNIENDVTKFKYNLHIRDSTWLVTF